MANIPRGSSGLAGILGIIISAHRIVHDAYDTSFCQVLAGQGAGGSSSGGGYGGAGSAGLPAGLAALLGSSMQRQHMTAN